MSERRRLASLKARIVRKVMSWILPDVREPIPEGTPLIAPSPNSPEGMRVPEVVAVSGRMGWRVLKLLLVLPYILETAYYARKCVRSVLENPPNAKRVADSGFFKELEAYARTLGISAIGYTKVPREYIFGNCVPLFENAIVLTMDMSKEETRKAPSV